MNPLSLFYTIRSYVEAYAGLVGRRFISVIWVVALCVVIWFYGFLLAFGSFKPLASVNIRILLVATVSLAWLGYLVFTIIRDRRRDTALVDGIEKSAEAEAAASQSAEVGEIHARLKDALQLLRRVTKRRFGYIYQLPWYVIFGAPGSGKTTALTNSGLSFPLGDALGGNSVQGIGGTRNCNWWFTDDAILIDTAGRYTTQDDLNGTAKAGWEGFLGLLRKYRRSQPVNGALVTLSIGDLISRDPESQRDEVRIIRQRLAELDEQLQVRVPVYLVLTKADLLTGFIEFFDGFNRSDREQVWGTTFSLEQSEAMEDLPQRVSEEFAQLQERVGAMLIERLQQEPSAEVRGRIFRFPAEFAALRERLQDVVEELCASSKLVEPPLLRGIYFASGTQVSEAGATGGSVRPRRSYFLTRLFKEVIFGEAALVARDKRLTRRQVMTRRAAYAIAGIAVSVVLTSWIATYVQNRAALLSAERRLDAFEELIRGIPVTNVADTDFLRILPAIDNLAAVSTDFDVTRAWPLSFGLDQQAKVEGRQRDAYRRALNALLLPRMLVQLQRDMQMSNDPEQTFDALKFYGMLGGLGPMDVDFAERQAEIMYSRLYPGEARQAVRDALTRHTAVLASGTLSSVELDNRLIAEARERIREIGVADRAFHILVQHRDAQALPNWTAAQALGPLGERAFIRRSGKLLRNGLAGIFTATGYRTVVSLRLDDAARDAVNEEWVRGEANPPETAIDAVGQAALMLYHAEFERQWRSLLADLVIKPSQTIADAAETTRILASEPNPVELLLRAIARETDLSIVTSPPASGGKGVTEAFASVVHASPPDPYGGLREMLDANAGESADGQAQTEMQQLIARLSVLGEQLSRATTSSAELAKVFDVDSQLTMANQDLLQQARRLPAPADTLMAGVAADIGSLAVKSARTRIAEAWSAEAANFCESVVLERYPFDRQSSRDAALADFVRLFAPDGVMKTFFDQRLSPFVDTTSTPWSWKGTFGSRGIESEAVAQFGYADQITRAFFPNGAKVPQVSVNVTPVSLSQAANAVKLELGGQPVIYFHGPIRSKSINWPSEEGNNSSSLAFQPGGWQNGLTATGDWSLFRLFDRSTLVPQGDRDLFRATFEQNGLKASFDIQFGSVLDPFRLPALSAFSCPKAF
ncbi:type VI secretion system membrane subunit TssM [Rhizobium sp. AAP43]|uniref:type VI secretion system membrane subunit TssM n=1 Tax=Rhizobium sp. AAP43 TaxID=1523420 RepID=UPI0006B985FB|nr:type VI secretion system membrane subunit TssM [Rhizobium sp. AAP43]KPF45779.1 type VI secretion protein IcmF [Rhizobium sp. AAP43]